MSSIQDDESDSSFLIKQRKAVKVVNDENDQNTKPTAVPLPPIIVQKCPARMVKIKPVNKHQSPNRNKIDKIVDNLKINLLQKQEQKKISKFSLLNQDEDLLDDLTNLSWLIKFDLSSTGLTPLSPPQSPKIKQNQDDDEADGCFHAKTKQISEIKSLIDSFVSLIPSAKNLRPSYSYSSLIFLAIESSDRKRLSVKEIYTWIIQTFPYYRSVPSGSWKNSIRQNLSYNQTFTKVDKNLLTMRDFSGKGSLWCINPSLRSLIIECALRKKSLDSILYLKDIADVPKTIFTSINTKEADRTNLLNSRASRITSTKPAILNPKIAASLNM